MRDLPNGRSPERLCTNAKNIGSRSGTGIASARQRDWSTLLMMVSALAGRERTLCAYALAVQKNYMFFSYGDCMLIV